MKINFNNFKNAGKTFTAGGRRRPRNNVNRGNKKALKIVIIILAVVFILGTLLLNFITDWIWFSEVGYTSVFLKKIITELKYGIPIFIVVAIIANIYLRRLKKGYFTKIVSHENTDLKKLNIITKIISIVSGLIIAGYAVSGLWFLYLKNANATSFGKTDPIFNLDISFYIFRLEFLQALNEIVIGAILLFVAITVIYYLVLLTMHTPDAYDENEAEPYEPEENQGRGLFGEEGKPWSKIRSPFGRRRNIVSSDNTHKLMNIASGQLSILGIVFFIMLALQFLLRQFDLLHAHTGVVYGAGFTDVNIKLWVLRILMAISIVGAIFITNLIHKKKFKKILIFPAALIAVALIGFATSWVVQSMIVAPDEINKENPYLARNIEYTQHAYDIDDVKTQPFAADNDLTADDLATNNETISNIRINDYAPVKTFYNQTQSIRQYYKFNDIDVDRYMLNGKYSQTYMSIREIDEEKINDTWINRHLKYTHGYGVALSRVDTVTPSGQPDVLIKNIPPESAVKEIKIDRPEIYFGELSDDYIVVNTSEDEFDYPDGQENKYTRYKGKAGIKMNFLNRMLFSLKERSLKLMVSTNVKSDSRLIINRSILPRIKKIMPYLDYEEDPYSVTVNGKIYWVLDAYTTSKKYPYSEPFYEDGENYIRNSVKVVVDAYNGDTSFYIVDKNDPIAKTYSKIFPGVFKDVKKMPKGLKQHLRYPNQLFKIQAKMYGRYHMNDVKVFYQNEDIWDIAHEMYGTKEQEIVPNYYIAKLPNQKAPEFISILPYTPKSKQNMTALFVARSDEEHYGQLMLYQFPKSKTIYGPMQIEAQIDQNTEISQDFSLWSSAGSKYSRGNLFVVPIKNSLMYIEPIYLEAANSAIPEVKRVIVAYGDTIAYKPTLQEALESLFGEGTGVQSVVEGKGNKGGNGGGKKTELTQSDYIKQASDAYAKGQEALKNGDWAEYGKAMDDLEDALNKLEK